MIVTTQGLKEKYKGLSDPAGRIARDVKNGKIIPLVKGIYETDGNVSGSMLAQVMYGPSYLSFDYALYYAGLIPEAVYSTFTSATYNKRKIKRYKNKFGDFIYRDVPKDVFWLGVNLIEDGSYTYHMASPEKALCDTIYTLPPLGNRAALYEALFDDLRIDEDTFDSLNRDHLLKLAPLYHSKNLKLLEGIIGG